MNQDSVPDIKAEMKTEEDILVPEWIKTEIKKKEHDLHVDLEGFVCLICEMRHVNEESFIQHVQQHHSTYETSQYNDNLSQMIMGIKEVSPAKMLLASLSLLGHSTKKHSPDPRATPPITHFPITRLPQ